MHMNQDNISLLLSINEQIATVHKPEEVMKNVFCKLSEVYRFALGGMALFDKNKTTVEIFLGDFTILNLPAEKMIKEALLLHEKYPILHEPLGLHLSAHGVIRLNTDVMLSDDGRNYHLDKLIEVIQNGNITELLQIPMQCSGEILGFLLLGATETFASSMNDNTTFLMQIANLLGVAMKNFTVFEELQQREFIQGVQLRLTSSLMSLKERDSFFLKLAEELNGMSGSEVLFNYVEIRMVNFLGREPVIVSLRRNENFEFVSNSMDKNLITVFKDFGIHFESHIDSIEIKDKLFDKILSQSPLFRELCTNNNISSVFGVHYETADNSLLELLLGFPDVSNRPDIELIAASYLLPQFALLLKNFAAYEEIDSLKKQLEQEKVSLIGEISSSSGFQQIIGASPVMQNVLYKIRQVAPLDATVLVLGETGTGKELIARAIHNTSPRKDKALIRVNCATLPSQLIESELFGHEKGSFTGAVEKRIGKFELANGGTIFLDEIGEMPLELQAKLLRVLQEKEFERIGGKQTIKVNVRVVAATNRNLEAEVESGKFRADLFFRLNVFPITVPPLRKRREDIPMFVQHFIEEYSRSTGKSVKTVSKSDLNSLISYKWPGNVRELEHVIERAVIISSGNQLELSDFIAVPAISGKEEISRFRTLREIERQHIIEALTAANGKVTGENSASVLLGINGKTLGSKMRKLGIKREIIISA